MLHCGNGILLVMLSGGFLALKNPFGIMARKFNLGPIRLKHSHMPLGNLVSQISMLVLAFHPAPYPTNQFSCILIHFGVISRS